MITSRSPLRRALVACAIVASGCGEPVVTGSTPDAEPGAITLEPVAWNPAMAEVGKVAGVAEIDGELVLFGDRGALLLSGGAIGATDASVTAWRDGATIPAADHNGAWAAGVDATGRVLRLRARSVLEDVSDRWGLGGVPVERILPLAPPRVAFLLGGDKAGTIAVADGEQVVRYDLAGVTGLASNGLRVAGLGADGKAHALHVVTGTKTSYAVPEATAVGFAADGSLWIAAKSALWAEANGGVAIASRNLGGVTTMTTSGPWLWARQGGELIAIRDGAFQRTRGLGLDASAALLPTATGDLWSLAAGALGRLAVPATGDEATWRTAVLPINARLCSSCHGPSGSSGIVISTYAQWSQRRALIRTRVVDTGDMPQGKVITDGEKQAIDAWAKAR